MSLYHKKIIKMSAKYKMVVNIHTDFTIQTKHKKHVQTVFRKYFDHTEKKLQRVLLRSICIFSSSEDLTCILHR